MKIQSEFCYVLFCRSHREAERCVPESLNTLVVIEDERLDPRAIVNADFYSCVDDYNCSMIFVRISHLTHDSA